MRTAEKFLTVVIAACTIAMLIYAFTSCTPKHRCDDVHKRKSWEKMTRRINSFN